MAKIRTEREHEVEKINKQMNEEIETIQTRERQQILQLDAKRQQCEVKNDEETCRSGWDLKIEEKRIHYEEQNELIREERDTKLEVTRVAGEEKLQQVRLKRKQQYDTHQEALTRELLIITQERDACEGDVESCQDEYDTEINQVHVKMEEEVNRLFLS